MGFIGDLGAPNVLQGSNMSGTGTTLLIILGVFLIVLVAGIITFNFYYKKKQQLQFQYKIHIFKEVHGEPQPIDDDLAMEVYVQDSNVSLFYLKKKKLYIARPTLSMGKNAYWYNILKNGEWVNFCLKGSKDGSTFSEANYDHRDTRYAYINLKEIIKKNYTDKSVKWWKEYAPLITLIVFAVIFIVGCLLIAAKMGKVINGFQPVADSMRIVSENLLKVSNTCQTSGMVAG
jgi:flagellar basal body-associated protein FliL